MTDTVRILIGSDNPTLHERVHALSDRVEVITPPQLEARPTLLGEIEIAYGGLGPSQISQAHRLRWLQTGGAGVNGLMTPEVQAADLVVTNASGIHAEPITEHMFGMLLMITRRLAQAWERQQSGHWDGAGLGERVEMLAGKTLGVLGVGAIGGHSAKVGEAFGMRVLGLRRGGEPHPHIARMYTPDQRREFLAECDVVMNSLPLTERTRGFLGPDEFRAIKAGAIVINTGRGATINTEALMAALREGRLGAALLDVTDPEPLPDGHPLWAMENVFITPHYSGSHPGYGERADRIFLENLRRYLASEPLVNVVDKQEGY
ncbi:MAG: D-2-hydroxyacid dehydrogenase [Armatimonadetes bacterium]|nr:D-2-hydroxyacid dehydrogenase [Armatimonadota bacterium]